MNISIIIPVYNEPDENIKEIHQRINNICLQNKYDYEILFVDDGSNNGVIDALKMLRQKDRRIKVISFDKNYGQINAVWAGFCYAQGEVLITMDCDLQYHPEEIPSFIEKIKEGFDVIGGKRPKQKIRFFSKVLTKYFNVLLKIKMQDHGCVFCALKKTIVEKMIDAGFTYNIKALALSNAKRPVEIDVLYSKRKTGVSAYSVGKYLRYGINYVLSSLKKHSGQWDKSFNIQYLLTDEKCNEDQNSAIK
ncbi:MAG: glycosyltransferase family 2 protein [Candidatus Omnitrophota bacterium]